MRTKDLVLYYIRRCFNGCYLPSNDFITDRIKADMGCEVEVVESAENSLKLSFSAYLYIWLFITLYC